MQNTQREVNCPKSNSSEFTLKWSKERKRKSTIKRKLEREFEYSYAEK